MTIDEIVEKFIEKDYLIKMGAGCISKNLGCSREDVYKAREQYYRNVEKKEDEEELKRKNELPRVLILDIETAPLRAYVWSRWKQNIYLEQTISEWFMISWAAKWLFESEVMSSALTKDEILHENDKRIIGNLWKLLEEADIVITHNGDKFDIPKINSRFIINGFPPTSPYQQIDTKKVSAKQFGFSSNKLDALAIYFGFDVKLDTDFELWSKCMDGDEESLGYMEQYNKHDVELLEEVYLKLRPWIKAHPNISLYNEITEMRCATCGSADLHESNPYYTMVGRFRTYRCSCGAINRMRFSDINKDKRKNILVSTAR